MPTIMRKSCTTGACSAPTADPFEFAETLTSNHMASAPNLSRCQLTRLRAMSRQRAEVAATSGSGGLVTTPQSIMGSPYTPGAFVLNIEPGPIVDGRVVGLTACWKVRDLTVTLTNADEPPDVLYTGPAGTVRATETFYALNSGSNEFQARTRLVDSLVGRRIMTTDGRCPCDGAVGFNTWDLYAQLEFTIPGYTPADVDANFTVTATYDVERVWTEAARGPVMDYLVRSQNPVWCGDPAYSPGVNL